MVKNLILVAITILFAISLHSCKNEVSEQSSKNDSIPNLNDKATTLDQIKARGKIKALTDFNSHGYFIYRGTPMGFQYDLMNSFAKHLGVKLEIIVENDLPKALKSVNNHSCDLLAMDLAVTKERKELLMFTEPIYQSQQILVQKLPEGWRKMRTWDEIESHMVRDIINLQGKTVHIKRGSVFYNRLNHINIETGGEIKIVKEDISVDELIRKVAEGEIEYTICDNHVAAVNKKYYRNIDIETNIGSYSQNLAWAIPPNSDSLLKEINIWLKEYKKSKEFYFVYNKYFKNAQTTMMAKSEYNSYMGGKISPYDQLIKEYADKIHWDWRLLASLIYQESKFNPDAESWSGAFGLMQMMPTTAQEYGVTDTSTPNHQIEAGASYIKLIDKQLKPLVNDSNERIKFVLASYNAGIAHILDARRLASKYNKNPEIWEDNVDYYLLKKSDPLFYKDSVVYYGYCRGAEPFKYVNEIFDRYHHYSNLIKDSIPE